MGFFVTEEIKVPNYGVTVSGAYVTIRWSINTGKNGSGMPGMGMAPGANDPAKPYKLSCTYYVYADKDAALQPLMAEQFSIQLAQPSVNPAGDLYTALKEAKFSGKTITDDK